MKYVSLEIAKAVKEAGYPQHQTDMWGYVNRPNNCYFTGSHSYYDEYRERRLEFDETNEFHVTDDWADEIEPSFYGSAIAAPTYLDVWLWLWHDKNTFIQVIKFKNGFTTHIFNDGQMGTTMKNACTDPEEAIISAIEYLFKTK